MKVTVLRLAMFLAIALSITSLTAQVDNRDFDLGGGGGAGSCRICQGSLSSSMSLSCGSPDPGGWGRQNCRIESYPEGAYCFVDGNECCVD
jgi:hypothetical protein